MTSIGGICLKLKTKIEKIPIVTTLSHSFDALV